MSVNIILLHVDVICREECCLKNTAALETDFVVSECWRGK